MKQPSIWPAVAKRVQGTIGEVNKLNFSESLIHLATVYGILSIAYYHDNKSLVSDAAYDALCKHLLDNYDEALAQGTYGTILVKDRLEEGTGYHLSNEASLPYSAQTLYDIYRAMGPLKPVQRVRKRPRPTAAPRKRARPAAAPTPRKRKRPVRKS